MKELKRRLPYMLLPATVWLCAISGKAYAQEHIVHRPQYSLPPLVEEQYNQGHYKAAEACALKYLRLNEAAPGAKTLDDITKAKYYLALSRLKLNEDAAEDSIKTFINFTANPNYKQRAALALGKYYFSAERFTEAIPFYEAAHISNLRNAEVAESKFELAYCYFNNKQFDKAEPLLNAMKEMEGKYLVPGNYYFGLLAYNGGRYQEALVSFKKIENEKKYRNIVPYYIAEIYYFSGAQQDALAEARKLINRSEKNYYDNELHLLAAQVLFEQRKYSDAIAYFEHYYDNTDQIRKEELYEMAYSYYSVNDWKKAIEKFKPLSNTQDSLGQTAMYLLGDCYLKTGDTKSARNAFSLCADMNFNKTQQETAMFLFGKLSIAAGYNSDAMTSLQNLLVLYPQTNYKSETKTLLSELLMRTNNYADAYNQLQEVREKDKAYYRAKQKVAYGYAMQQLQQGNKTFAASLLDESLQQPADEAYAMAATFWKAVLSYRLHQPQAAIPLFKKFIERNDAAATYLSSEATIANASLHLGYALMDLDDYKTAQAYFNKASLTAPPLSPLAVTATIREADAAFMQKDFKEAGALYDKSIQNGGSEADYARIQKSILLGVQGKQKDKIDLLQTVLNRNPASAYANDARYELGSTYIEAERYQQAINTLQPLAGAEGKNYTLKSLQKIAFAYQQIDKDGQAAEYYSRIVKEYPSGEERSAALEALRSIYVEQNKPDKYAAVLKENNITATTGNGLDSTYYAAAEAQVASGKWADAKEALTAYLDKFPQGEFVTRAHFYLAESYYQLKQYKESLPQYDAVLSAPWSEFTESSAKRAATLAFDDKDYTNALRYYDALRGAAMGSGNLQLAYSGMMRSAFNDGNYTLAEKYADTLLALPELSEEVTREMQFYKARSLQNEKKPDAALPYYRQAAASKDLIVAAEARYRTAQVLYETNKLKDAEAEAVNAIKLSAGNEYWVVKSYLLIADILVTQKDYFNAKATLQSIVKNSKDSALKKEAATKLDEVKRMEQQQSKLKQD